MCVCAAYTCVSTQTGRKGEGGSEKGRGFHVG